MTEEKIKKGPSQGGTHPAYYPEYKNSDGIWKPLEIGMTKGWGIKPSNFSPSPDEIVGLMSYEAATALIWATKANSLDRLFKEFRILEYQLTYSIETTEKGYLYIERFKPELTKIEETSNDQ